MDEKKLAERLRKKDSDAYLALIDEYGKLLWAIAGGILSAVGTREDVEECVSDVFFKLWSAPEKYDSERGSLKNYLALLTKSNALDMYRKQIKHHEAELPDCFVREEGNPPEQLENKETIHDLYEEIGQLREPDREILVRRWFWGQKPAFIARQMDLPVREVENKLYQSKQKLRKGLERRGIGYGRER